MKLAIVIPAYNESSVIADVLKNLPKKIDCIDLIIPIVIDDGSTDDTFEVAKKNTKHVLRHIVNLGVGAATQTGFGAAKKLGADIIVTVDADGQHCPNDIKKVISPILAGNADVVIGTRMLDSKGMPFIKIFGNWAMNILTLLVFHKWSSDTQSGMRAFNTKAIKKMRFHSIGYEICSEMIGEIKRNNLRLVEIPIKVIYTNYSRATGQNWLNAVNILTKIITIKITGKK
jgi:glycosyltransferase involved in cell wall biosynthesis